CPAPRAPPRPLRFPYTTLFRSVVPTLLGIGLLAGLFTTAPWPTLTFIGAVYIASIPLTVRASLRLRRAAEARRAEPTEPPAAEPVAVAATPAPPLDGHPPANEW